MFESTPPGEMQPLPVLVTEENLISVATDDSSFIAATSSSIYLAFVETSSFSVFYPVVLEIPLPQAAYSSPFKKVVNVKSSFYILTSTGAVYSVGKRNRLFAPYPILFPGAISDILCNAVCCIGIENAKRFHLFHCAMRFTGIAPNEIARFSTEIEGIRTLDFNIDVEQVLLYSLYNIFFRTSRSMISGAIDQLYNKMTLSEEPLPPFQFTAIYVCEQCFIYLLPNRSIVAIGSNSNNQFGLPRFYPLVENYTLLSFRNVTSVVVGRLSLLVTMENGISITTGRWAESSVFQEQVKFNVSLYEGYSRGTGHLAFFRNEDVREMEDPSPNAPFSWQWLLLIPVSITALVTCCAIMVYLLVLAVHKRNMKNKLLVSMIQEDTMAQDLHFSTNIGLAVPLIDFSELSDFSELGYGGSGTVVLRAKWKNQPVAVKLFQAAYLEDDARRNEFEQEIRIMNGLNHPNIVRFIAASMKPPRFALIMQLCENGSLSSVIKKRKDKITFEQKAKWLIQVAKGVRYLHGMELIHRDLKCTLF